jgi:hypothetical protein
MAATLVALVALVAGVSPGAAGADDTPAAQGLHAHGDAAHGRRALVRAGGDLGTIAQRNGLDESKLRSILENDDTAWLDQDDVLFYRDDVAPRPPAPDLAPAAPFPYANTFLLHSRPGSSKVIYLDFDGHSLVNSPNGWFGTFAGMTSPYEFAPYDTDNNTGRFSNEELDAIQALWQQVAEDYSPFDVDVTTADPGVEAIRRTDAADDHYGTRAVITTSTLQSQCACGGIAFLRAFAAYQPLAPNPHDYYQPAIVFSRVYSNGTYNISIKATGEAISHEVGHNLGLSHDGTAIAEYYVGTAEWGPIMGAAYSSRVVQFSKGEYYDANNKEDDFAVILANGLSYRPDDAGDTLATARPLGDIPTATFDGVISSANDVDVFEFTPLMGSYSITASAAQPSPNLDIKLELLLEDGSVESVSDLPYSDAFIGIGGYDIGVRYLRVSGVGSGNPLYNGYSTYGSVGQYHLVLAQSLASVRVVTSPPVPALITINGDPIDQWGMWATRAAGMTYNVCFGAVPGFDTPPCQSIYLNPDTQITLTGTYAPRGQLRVITQPAVASTISVDGQPRNDWGMWTDFPVGAHTVCFGRVAGFDPPSCQNVVVTAAQTTTVTGTFTTNPAAVGDTDNYLLRITTDPAVPTQITIATDDGTGTYGPAVVADSWALTWVKLPRVNHRLCFRDVAGYAPLAAFERCNTIVTPPSTAPGSVVAVPQSFTRVGVLRVVTSPPSPTSIVVDGLPRNDWGMWTDFPNGQHTVCFANIPGKKAPPCQTVTVTAGQTTTVTGVFS